MAEMTHQEMIADLTAVLRETELMTLGGNDRGLDARSPVQKRKGKGEVDAATAVGAAVGAAADLIVGAAPAIPGNPATANTLPDVTTIVARRRAKNGLDDPAGDDGGLGARNAKNDDPAGDGHGADA